MPISVHLSAYEEPIAPCDLMFSGLCDLALPFKVALEQEHSFKFKLLYV